MMRATVYPVKNFYQRPMFWGMERDLKDVLDNIEHVWMGTQASATTSQFKETEQGYFLSVDVPGLNKSNLEIQLEGDHVLIKGKRKALLPEASENERTLSQSFQLPKDVDAEKIQAHCEDGVLCLALPKLEKARPKKIEITEGEGKSSWKNLIGGNFFGKKETETTTGFPSFVCP